MGLAEMLLSKRHQVAVSQQEPKEAESPSHGEAPLPDSASTTPPSELSPVQAEIAKIFPLDQLAMLQNPMVKGMLEKIAGGPIDQLFRLASLASEPPEKAHQFLHGLHEKIGALLHADGEAGISTPACGCAQPSERWEDGNLRHDGGWQDIARGHAEDGVASAVPTGQSVDHRLETALPGSVAAQRDEREAPVPEVGHIEPA